MTELAVVRARMQGLAKAARAVLVERDQEIETAVIALLARANHLQLGPPGTGKSYLATTMTSLVDGTKYYETLITGQSLEEQLYGPISLKGMEEDRYLRKTAGYLPEADIAFIDEFYRGSGPILNANLWILNERKFHNDGQVYSIPLITLYAAANDGPTDPDLAAIHDRMDFKHVVNPITTEDGFLTMINRSIDPPTIEPVIDVATLREAHGYVDAITIAEDCKKALTKIWKELGSKGIHPSDRKFVNAIRMARASAFLGGRAEAEASDLSILVHALWNEAEERADVMKVVLKHANPIDREAANVLENLKGLSAQVEDAVKHDSRAVRVRKTLNLIQKLELVGTEIDAVSARAKKAGIASKRIGEARRQLTAYSRKLIREGFEYTGDINKFNQDDIHKIVASLQGAGPESG